MRAFVAVSAFMGALFAASAFADYELGCDDPAYQQYMQGRYAHFEARNQREFERTLRDYNLRLSGSDNPYQVISSLSRHLKYSAQFDPINEVEAKIDRIFEHANALTISEQIAGDVFDGFSSETHSVGIAQAWIAYRQGQHEPAFEQLLQSIEVTGSALLSSFGPDFDLVRQIYRDGHVAPVVAYINKTKGIWTGSRADEMRALWLRMVEAGCGIQFDSIDSIKAKELGLGRIDLGKLVD